MPRTHTEAVLCDLPGITCVYITLLGLSAEISHYCCNGYMKQEFSGAPFVLSPNYSILWLFTVAHDTNLQSCTHQHWALKSLQSTSVCPSTATIQHPQLFNTLLLQGGSDVFWYFSSHCTSKALLSFLASIHPQIPCLAHTFSHGSLEGEHGHTQGYPRQQHRQKLL